MIFRRPKAFLLIWVTLILGLGFSKSANADNIYDYTGNIYTSCYGSYAPCFAGQYAITGSFTVPTALAPNLTNQVLNPSSFSFTDGLITLTQSNTVTSYFQVSTDAAGNIDNWTVNATLYSIYYTASYELGSYETIYSSPGTDWSIWDSYFTFSVPIEFPNPVYCEASQSYTYECGANTYQGSLYSGASNGANPGSWVDPPSDPVSTPEPSSLLLVGVGLLALVVWKWNFGFRID